MMKFISFLCLVIFPFVASEYFEDYRLSLAAAACTPRNCTEPGPLCETCSTLVGCLEEPNGTFIKTPLETCTAPSYCVDDRCTSDYDPFCWGAADLPFNCSKVGIFPDAFYRGKFVLCVQEGATKKPYLNSCEAGFGFNISNDLCNIRVENGECPSKDYPVPLCETVGQTGPLPEKPAMYYICKELVVSTSKTILYPYLDVCSGDTEYIDYSCGHPVPSTTPPPPTTTVPPPLF